MACSPVGIGRYTAMALKLFGVIGPAETEPRRRPQAPHRPAARVDVDQLPAVAAAGGVLGQQYVARLQREMMPAAGLKIERAAQGDHQLPGGRVVPIERAASSGLMKGYGRDRQLAGENIAMRT